MQPQIMIICCLGGFTPENFENKLSSYELEVMTKTCTNIFGEVFGPYMRPLLPMRGLGAKNTQTLTKGDRA